MGSVGGAVEVTASIQAPLGGATVSRRKSAWFNVKLSDIETIMFVYPSVGTVIFCFFEQVYYSETIIMAFPD